MASLRENINQAISDFNGIEKAIEDSGVDVPYGTDTKDYGDKVKEVYQKGKSNGEKSAYDTFWDACQDSGKRKNYNSAFVGYGWNDTTFNPKYSMNTTDAGAMFRMTQITDLKGKLKAKGLSLDTSKSYTLLQIFQNAKTKHIPTIDASIATNMSYGFSSTSIITIEKLIVSSKTPFVNTFRTATNLEEMIVEGTMVSEGFNVQWSPKLSHDSLVSIINALSDNSSGTATKTVTFGATNIAKLTSEEVEIATEKGWKIA